MKEVEVKLLEVNRKKMEEKLISLGAKKIFDDVIETTLFDFEDNSIKKSKSVVRIRKEGERYIFTLKKFLPGTAKIRDEYETEISNPNNITSVLDSLGLSPRLKTKKHRISYKLGNVHFDFDKYIDEHKFIPEYLEIEANDEKTVYKYAKLLGFKKEECKNWGFMKVFKYYSK